MRLASRHSIVIAVGRAAGYVTLDRLSAVQPIAARGMEVLSVAGLAIGRYVSERQRGATRLRVRQPSIAQGSPLCGFGRFAATLAHEINQHLNAIGDCVRVTTTGPQGTGLDLSLSRSIIESDGSRLTIAGDRNGVSPISGLHS